MGRYQRTKACRVCSITKPLSDFYGHGGCRDGTEGTCKLCRLKYQKAYQQRPDVTICLKEYSRLPHVRAKKAEYDKGAGARALKRARRLGSITVIAVNAINNGLKRGTVKKEPCMICGTSYRVEGHHPDYSRPLHVVWLCKPHHDERHAIIKALELARG